MPEQTLPMLLSLAAFIAVGVFVTFSMYDGPGDIFSRAAGRPDLDVLLAPFGGAAGGYASWAWLTVLSMLAFVFLPRQFQVAVIEATDERHLKRSIRARANGAGIIYRGRERWIAHARRRAGSGPR